MIDTKELRRLLEEDGKNNIDLDEIHELLDRLEAAEKERDNLRAKIEAMERQDCSKQSMPAEVSREFVMYAIAQALGDAYDCTRVWSAWGYGTMSHDDFQLIAEDGDRLREIADAAIMAMGASAPKPCAQPAPSVPEGFSREDLEAVADGLDGYEKTVNVGNVTGGGDDHLESTTAYAARFIRAMLASPEAKP